MVARKKCNSYNGKEDYIMIFGLTYVAFVAIVATMACAVIKSISIARKDKQYQAQQKALEDKEA